MFDIGFDIPVSREIAEAISSMRAPRAAAIFVMNEARSSGVRALHEMNAALAAAAALLTSPAVPSGMVAMTSSVIESNTEIVAVASDATHWPLI